MNILDTAIKPAERMTKNTGARNYPTTNEIACLAYRLYEMHGRRDGHDVDDWLAAEKELAHHYAPQPV